MKTYRLFASVYENVEQMTANKPRDEALDTHNISGIFTTNADTLNEAMNAFFSSTSFDDFLHTHNRAIPYYLDDDGCPHIYE